MDAKYRSSCRGLLKREIELFHVNIPLMDFIINKEGHYKIILSKYNEQVP
jgi:hypothetical protein